MTDRRHPQDPGSEAFEFWVRSTALDAAARVAAERVTQNTRPDEAVNYVMVMVERFEAYLNTGMKRPS